MMSPPKAHREKDKVVVEIMSYPTEKILARGVILEVLGKAGRYDTEIKSVIHQFHLAGRVRWTVASSRHEEPRPTSIQIKSMGREDLTDKVIVTIDPD